MRRADLVRYWLPAAIWSAAILVMSGRAGSATLTLHMLQWILPATDPMFDTVHFILRKLGHLLAYGLLGGLDFRAVRGAQPGWTPRWSVWAIVLAVAIAAIDEGHQTMVPGRTGLAGDVVIDACGASIAQVFYRLQER